MIDRSSFFTVACAMIFTPFGILLQMLCFSVAVSESDSIMYYTEAGTDWWTYNNNTFVPIFADGLSNSSSISESFNQSAHDTCGGNSECLYDVFATGSLEVGATSKQTGEENEQQSAIICMYYILLFNIQQHEPLRSVLGNKISQ